MNSDNYDDYDRDYDFYPDEGGFEVFEPRVTTWYLVRDETGKLHVESVTGGRYENEDERAWHEYKERIALLEIHRAFLPSLITFACGHPLLVGERVRIDKLILGEE